MAISLLSVAVRDDKAAQFVFFPSAIRGASSIAPHPKVDVGRTICTHTLIQAPTGVQSVNVLQPLIRIKVIQFNEKPIT